MFELMVIVFVLTFMAALAIGAVLTVEDQSKQYRYI